MPHIYVTVCTRKAENLDETCPSPGSIYLDAIIAEPT